MSTKYKRFVDGSLVATSATTYYTAPASTKAVIRNLAFTCQSTNAQWVHVYLVPSGGTAGTGNAIANARAIAPNETWVCQAAVGQVLEAGGMLQCTAGTSSSVAVVASGVEIV